MDKVTEIIKKDLIEQGFKYIGIEASMLNGLNVKLTYNIKVYNESEDDYVTEKVSKIKNIQELVNLEKDYEENGWQNAGISEFNTGKDIYYGYLVGLHYYTNTKESAEAQADTDLIAKYKYGYTGEQKDVKVTTTVDQLVDYIDNDISRDKEATSGTVNQAWVDSSATDREHKLSAVSYVDNEKADEKLKDNKGRSYIGTNKNNISFSQNENMVEEPITITRTKVQRVEKSGELYEPYTEIKDGM